MRSVVIEAAVCVPRFCKTDPKKLTRKRYRTWVVIGRGRVLHYDRECIIVKQAGFIGIFDLNGMPQYFGYKRNRLAQVFFSRPLGFRINPESIKRLYGR